VPSAWAPVSICQRDMQAFNLKVPLLAVLGQLYDSDRANPLLVAFGNFGLAFVLVFLLPLLVIALTYNVWSADQELGTWDLLQSQPASVRIAVAVN
jgi:ABC-2 type transport system permease protein